MTLWESVMRSQAPIKKTMSEFYGSFAELNNDIYDPPDQEAIKNFQMHRLREFQKASYKNSQKAQEVNQFLLTKGSFNSDRDPHKTIEKSIEKIYNDIILDIRRSGALVKANRENQDIVKTATIALRKLEEELRKIETLIGRPISGTYIDKLKAYVNDAQKVGGVTADEILRNFWSLQGEILEEIGTEWFNSKIPSDMQVKAVSTAKVELRGKGQLVTDILVMDMATPDLNNIDITYVLDGRKHTEKLGKFLDTIQTTTSESNKHIILEQPELDKVLSNAVAGIQAKSGKNQLPWNKETKNTQVKIADMDRGEAPVYALNRLHDLLITPKWDAAKNMKAVDPAYQAMANYGLGTMMARVMHLSQDENQFVLTPEGFMTYTERIEQLFRNNGYYFFIHNVKLSEDMLTTVHKVDMGK